jgi:hypothetical protein
VKLYGYPSGTDAEEGVVPDALAEITLVASPPELRRIAEFMLSAASNMERLGDAYGHEHLSDWDRSFASSPHFCVALPSSGAG